MVEVYGYGRTPSPIMFIGEAPGHNEARLGRAFVGASGAELRWYLSKHNLSPDDFYLTNVCKTYIESNPDPTPELISKWTPHLKQEILDCSPQLIVAVGRYAAQWLLGDRLEMEACHGLPHKGGEFGDNKLRRSQLVKRCNGAIILPVYHPAYGLWSPKAKSLIDWDYSQVAHTWKLIRTGQKYKIQYREDKFAGKEQYLDVTGDELATHLSFNCPEEIGLDTEGIPSNPWSIQVSWNPGTAYTLRIKQPDFSVGVQAIQYFCVDKGCTIITHDAGTPSGCLYDTIMCRAMGLELSRARLWNTMYAAYLLRNESRALKTLMYRWCGMQGEDYMALVSGIGREKQIDYLQQASSHKWSKPEPYVEHSNDGSSKLKKPKSVNSRIERILIDCITEKTNKDGEIADPYKRWHDVDKGLRVEVERELGLMPTATLDDVPLEKAVFYSCLHGESLVFTEYGTIQIKQLVNDQMTCLVQCVDVESGELTWSPITNWYRFYHDDQIQWKSICTEITRVGRWGPLATRYTPDHRLLTGSGWKEIQSISLEDSLCTGVPHLTYNQLQLTIGSVLGDGFCSRRNATGWASLRFSNKIAHKDYVDWKTSLLGSIRSVTGVSEPGHGSYGTSQYWACSEMHPSFLDFVLKEDKTKKIGDWIEDIDALGLAIWYMDDGTLVRGGHGFSRLYTHDYSLYDIDILRSTLKRKFDLDTTVSKVTGRDQWFICFNAKSSDKFFILVCPYIHSVMQYKLPERFQGYFRPELEDASKGLIYSKVTKVFDSPVNKRGGVKTSYCIDVADHHNFIVASNEVAHNCRDADGTLRLKRALEPELRRLELI